MQAGGSVKAGEIEKFDALAAQWWDTAGPMRPLHMMNGPRSAWILERIVRKYGQAEGVRVLDVGCGAGLLSEALAKAGCVVTGQDAAGEAVAVARAHAAAQGLAITYRTGSAEEIMASEPKFPVITALEIIEHVADPGDFVATLAGLLAPGGVLFISTLNRTPQSFLAAKVGAEYVVRMLPIGTHDWNQFVTPMELGNYCRDAALRLADAAGLSFEAGAGRFKISRDLGVNYIVMAEAAP
jgi:2-polyprenyl-6-hydroxyphenyl methylase/3-demethylubiquinone-9 3-methyltransferase